MRVLRHPEVEAAFPLYTGTVLWRDPWNGAKRSLFVYGIVPYAPAIGVPGVTESAGPLHEADTCLFDTRSRKEFDTVLEKLAAGQQVAAEVNGRRVKVVGTTTIGASFDVDGNLVTSDVNFIRLFPQRTPASIEVGVVRLLLGSDPGQVKNELQRTYGSDLLVLTTGEFKERGPGLISPTRPVDFIFAMGTAVGFFVGFAIVYQVLFSDVSNHSRSMPRSRPLAMPTAICEGWCSRKQSSCHCLDTSRRGLAAVLYVLTAKATSLPMLMTFSRGLLIFVLTITMCSFSGLVAIRTLKQSDPADVF